MITVTVSNEDELYEVLEPYLSGEELEICRSGCKEDGYYCDCEPSQVFNRKILVNDKPFFFFTWYEATCFDYPCVITILE
jgi:hypothetical protein